MIRQNKRERWARAAKITLGLFLLANLGYAFKSALGINVDHTPGPAGHHGNLFPIGEWLIAPLRNGSVFDSGPPDRPAKWYSKQKQVEEICRIHPDRCPWYQN